MENKDSRDITLHSEIAEIIEGEGGLFGKVKSPTTPKPVAESGRSISKGMVIEVLCSGGDHGIEGLGQNPKANIYLDDTPIVANNIENFKGIEVTERRGTPGQLPLSDFNSEVTSEVAVGVTVQWNNPVTRTFVNDNCAAVRLRFSFVLNENQKDSNGTVVGTKQASINFKIFIKQGVLGNFVEFANITQTGKYSEPYEKVWFFNIDPSFDEYSIRVERVTPNDTEDFRRQLRWESYSIVIDSLLSFKRLAYVGLKFNAEDFGQSIPNRRYQIKGLILPIPSNATIDDTDRGLNYTGNWDGNFIIPSKTCSSFLPIIWYLLTDTIDGCGIPPQNINRWSLYNIDLYNNQFVSNGNGGLERRFLFNFVFNKEGVNPYDLINWVASGCNCRMVEEYGQITFIQDRPSPIFCTLTNADVVEGKFNYSTVDCTDIATQVAVTWTDQTNGKTRTEFINDPNLIAKYGKQTKQIEAVGCDRRTQAIRMGRAIIYSEANEVEIVTFQARDFAYYIPIGSVIAIQDLHLNGLVYGDLVKTASTTTIGFDNPITLTTFDINSFNEEFYLTLYPDIREGVKRGWIESGYAHYLLDGQREGRLPNGYLIHIPDANLVNHIRVIRNSINNLPTNTLTFDALPFTPAVGTPFMLQVPGIPLKTFRVESKEYEENTVTITAKQYDDYKWDWIENGFSIEANTGKVVKYPIYRPNPVTNLRVDYFITTTGFNIELSWNVPTTQFGNDPNIIKYFIVWTIENGTGMLAESPTNNFTVTVSTPGTYLFKVIAENVNYQRSDDSETVSVFVTDTQDILDFSTANSSAFIF